MLPTRGTATSKAACVLVEVASNISAVFLLVNIGCSVPAYLAVLSEDDRSSRNFKSIGEKSSFMTKDSILWVVSHSVVLLASHVARAVHGAEPRRPHTRPVVANRGMFSSAHQQRPRCDIVRGQRYPRWNRGALGGTEATHKSIVDLVGSSPQRRDVG